jgi:hypothetical protein
MSQRAYLCLTDDNHWAVVAGDGSEPERMILAIGDPFDMDTINQSVADLDAWAQANDIDLTSPEFPILCNWTLEDLIEPEVFDQVFGDE